MSTNKNIKKLHGIKTLEKRLGKMTVGNFLRSWRLAEDLSQKVFAKQIKMSAANLCDIELGRKGGVAQKRRAKLQRSWVIHQRYLLN